jgi:hypothetical protein
VTRKLLFVLSIAMMLIGLGARLEVAFRTPARLSVVPLQDDSYYTQSYARQMWAGEFFSINDEHRGNAYHPLYPILCAPLHGLSGSNPVLGIRLVALFNVILFIASLWMASRVYRRLAPGNPAPTAVLFGLGLYAVHALAFENDMNLMQTGLQLLLLWTLLDVTLRLHEERRKRLRDYLLVGGIGALACLTRIDVAIVIFGYGITMLLNRHRWELTVSRFLAVTAPGACAVLVWCVVSYFVVGSFLPTGGAANASGIVLPSSTTLGRGAVVLSLASVGLPHSYVNVFWSPWWTANPWARPLLSTALFTVFVLLLLRNPVDVGRLARNALPALAPMLVGTALLVVTYVMFTRATYFFSRYFAVVLPVMGCFWFLLVANAFERRHERRVISVGVISTLLFSFYLYRVSNLEESYWWTALDRVQALSQESDWIASPETGLLGYYHRRTINLDGKTNVEALRARQSGSTVEYLSSTDARFTVDGWGAFNTQIDGVVIAQDSKFLAEWELVVDGPFIWRRRSLR